MGRQGACENRFLSRWGVCKPVEGSGGIIALTRLIRHEKLGLLDKIQDVQLSWTFR